MGYEPVDPVRDRHADEKDNYDSSMLHCGPSSVLSANVDQSRLFLPSSSLGKRRDLDLHRRLSQSAQAERRDFSSLTECQDADANARPRMAGPDRSEAGCVAVRNDLCI